MAPNSILLKNGTFLIHDANNHVVPTATSVLVEDGKIVKIAQGIEARDGVEVIDCTEKIISPGFVDTHHHGWQTQLKGRHANEQLLPYIVTGNVQSMQYTPQDMFYAQLAAMLEGLAAGTTTVVDHAHLTQSPEHAEIAIAGTASSGIRSIFCYTPIARVKSFNPYTPHPDLLPPWVMETFQKLAEQGPFGDGRVTLGFAFDLFFLPAEMVKGIFAQVKSAGVRTITVHGSTALALPIIPTLHKLDLLDEHIIVSHGGTVRRADAELLMKHNAHLSSTPSSELQMAMGRPYAFDASFSDGGWQGDAIGMQSHASFGVDCHSMTASSIVSEAKLGLANARNHFNEYYMRKELTPKTLPDNLSVEAAFNLATIKGAEAVRMEGEIGRIAEGFKADLVIFDGLSPGMVAASQHDPVAAIILHSSPADIEMVIVDGTVRKKNGKLVDVSVDESARSAIGKETLEWSAVAKEIVESRARMQKEMEKIDYEEGNAAIYRTWYLDESKFVEV